MTQYRQASFAAQLALSLLLFVTVVICFYLQGIVSQLLVDIQLLLHVNPQQALKTISRLLLWLVTSGGLISVAIGVYLYRLSKCIATEGIYPPAGLPVMFKTELLTGTRANKMRWVCLLLAALLMLQPILGAALWYGLTGGVL